MKPVSEKTCLLRIIIAIAFVLALSCGAHAAASSTAVVALAAMDYSSGAHQLIDVDPAGGPRTAGQPMAFGGSDITVVADGDCFYRLSRSQAHHISKYRMDDPGTVIWQYSVEGDESDSNPHDFIKISDTKAYVLRYGSSRVWIVNPAAAAEADFKIGEIDLSAYADNDGLPEIHSGVRVGDRVFLTMQRIDFSGGWGNYVYHTPYVAVIDTTTDTEVETGKGEDGLAGIPLPFENPNMIQYLEENDTVYVQGVGQWGAAYTSGIAAVDAETYDASLVWDDGTESDHPYGTVSGMMMVSPEKGYLIAYEGWGDNTLYRFNPSDGTELPVPVSEDLSHVNIATMESGLTLDPNGMFWVGLTRMSGDGSVMESEIAVLDTQSDTVDEIIPLSMQPLKVVFCASGDAGGSGSSSGGSCFIRTSAQNSRIVWPMLAVLAAVSVSGWILRRKGMAGRSGRS